MFQDDLQLISQCKAYRETIDDAAHWTDVNRELVRSELESLQAELRKSNRFFKKCEIAAGRKMCVGVFGPSQSGKSYLISTLARDANGQLFADFAGEQRNFISEINPEGGKESTGLVTRFTMTQPAEAPQGFPVRLRLLSEMDIVKIIANTYYSDCEVAEAPDPQAISAELDKLLSVRRVAEPISKLTIDDIEELHEYLVENFKSKPRVQCLERVFWNRMYDIASSMDVDTKTTLFSFIWGGVPQFTALYKRLHDALTQIDFSENVYCSIEGLIPREQSIIDVAMLKGLSTGSGGELAIATRQGKKAILPRSVVTALTAEITIVMRNKPDDFFDHTDLLDFPGYRSRKKIKDIHQALEKEAPEDFFLRGKVSYLFERYCAEKELTSMLLCIGPSNQEVQDLPGVIDKWVRSTHGVTPEKRTGKPISLFFVLTKFDTEFQEKKGVSTPGSRWYIRIHSSLLDYFGKQHDWPEAWDDKGPFNNVFWLRNPNVDFKAILDYENADGDNKREKGVKPAEANYVAGLKQAFLDSTDVCRHFQNPCRAWDAAMTLNDGGIAYLKEKLRPLCNPELKRSQIAAMIKERAGRIASRLQPYFYTDNKEEERKKKEALATTLVSVLAKIVQAQRFGEFLQTLQMKDHEFYDLYFQVESQWLNQGDSEQDGFVPAPSQTVGHSISAGDILGDLGLDDFTSQGEQGSAEPAEQNASPDASPKDETAYFANLIEKAWIEHVHSVAESQVFQTYFGFSSELFILLVSELIIGADRLGLLADIEQTMREAARFRNIRREKIVWKQVSLAANIINSFVNWLGYDPRRKTAVDRTIAIRGKERVLFNAPPQLKAMPVINEDQTPFDKQFYTDWLAALIVVITANVDGGKHIDVAQNRCLGDILKQLAASV